MVTFVTSIKFLILIGIFVAQTIIIAIWGTYIILFYHNLTGEAESIYNFILIQTIISYCISAGLGAETYNVKRSRQRSYSSSINIINFINLFLSIYAIILYFFVSENFKHDYKLMWYYLINIAWISKVITVIILFNIPIKK